MNESMSTFLFLAGAYLVGALPCGWLIARMKGVRDIREHGSGNIGATNVARTLGIRWFFVTFFIDMLKAYGWLSFMIAHGAHERLLFDAALVLLVGNAYSVFLQFSGGKGVATSFGILLALMPAVAAVTLILWLLLFALLRTVGKASIGALALAPVSCFFLYGQLVLSCALCLVIALWTVVRHRDNLKQYFSA